MLSRNPLPSVTRLIVVLALILALFSCSHSGGEVGLGSLNIRATVQDLSPTETFEPGDDDIVDFHVRGDGPNGESFDVTVPVSETTITVNALSAGWWDIFVDARNSSGIPILTGSGTVLIEDGVATDAQVTLTPISGQGDLVVEYRWPTTTITSPNVAGWLSHYSGGTFSPEVELTPFSPSESGGVTTYRYVGTHAAGYHNLRTEIYDGDPLAGGIELWSNTYSVRIRDGFQTLAIIDLETGDITITIILDRQDPLAVGLTPSTTAALSSGQDMTVTSTITGGTAPFEYRWYLDGVLLAGETTDQVTIGSALDPGRYTLSLVASDATVLGSEYIVFDVVP